MEIGEILEPLYQSSGRPAVPKLSSVSSPKLAARLRCTTASPTCENADARSSPASAPSRSSAGRRHAEGPGWRYANAYADVLGTTRYAAQTTARKATQAEETVLGHDGDQVGSSSIASTVQEGFRASPLGAARPRSEDVRAHRVLQPPGLEDIDMTRPSSRPRRPGRPATAPSWP